MPSQPIIRITRTVAAIAGLLVIGHSLPAADPSAADVAEFRKAVQPFLEQHCVKCHGEKKQASGLVLHTMSYDLSVGNDVKTWMAIAERLATNEMPPEDQPRPKASEVERVVARIKAELIAVGQDVARVGRKMVLPGHGNRVDHDSLFRAGSRQLAASPARLWRVSPHIYTGTWERTVRRMRGNLGQPFSTRSGPGIKDYSSLYTIDEPTIELLLSNARRIIDYQVVESMERQQRGQSPNAILVLLQSREPSGRERMEAAIRHEFQAVLERNPTEAELERFIALMGRNIRDAGLEIGVKSTLSAVFLLPEALYRLEMGGDEDGHGRRLLTPRELVIAISYALRDDIDRGLLSAARDGRLATREDVRREVKRMLDVSPVPPRVLRFFEEYFDFPSAVDVFKDLPTGQPWHPELLVEDTRHLIRHILQQDRDVLKELLTTNKAFVNYRLDRKGVPEPAVNRYKQPRPQRNKATGKLEQPPPVLQIHQWYNLPESWQWTKSQPIELPAEQRAGILTQPSWLAAFATNEENHAILRGKWVRERLLGGVVPDLPIMVDAQLPDAPHQTLRRRMQVTTQEYCWQCHRKMNPLGLAFEQFDYLGSFRTTEPVLDVAATARNGAPIMHAVALDSSGLVEDSGDAEIDGEYRNAVAMLHRLADSPRVRQVFIRHAFRYWMGRNETLADAPTLAAADQAYVQSGGSMKALIVALLTSDSFLYRTGGKPQITNDNSQRNSNDQ